MSLPERQEGPKSRQQGFSRSTVVFPNRDARAGLNQSGTWNSSWLRISRTTAISSFSSHDSKGMSSLAATIWLRLARQRRTGGMSMRRIGKVVPARVMRFRP